MKKKLIFLIYLFNSSKIIYNISFFNSNGNTQFSCKYTKKKRHHRSISFNRSSMNIKPSFIVKFILKMKPWLIFNFDKYPS